MKRLLLAMGFVTAVCGLGAPAEAAFITGQQAFGSDATVSAPGNDIDNTSFDFSFSTLVGGANQTGDFVGTLGSFFNSLDTTAAAGFVFGDATYGTFTVTSVNLNDLTPGIARALNFSGTFTPGVATFGPGFDPTPAALTITINQASPGVLSASATLAAEIPEPASIVLLGTFCGSAGLGWLRRRKGRARQLAT